MFWELILTFVKVTFEKIERGTFCTLPFLNRVNTAFLHLLLKGFRCHIIYKASLLFEIFMKSDLKSTILKNPFVPILYTLINSGILKILVRKNGSSLLSNKKNKKKQKKIKWNEFLQFPHRNCLFLSSNLDKL